jgi:hypothetical protein
MPKPALKPDEHEIETYRANRSQGSRAVGGHLLLTDQRVLFYPHKLDSSTGGKSWESALGSIANVGLSERGRNPFDGSMRRRLKIESDGAIDFSWSAKPSPSPQRFAAPPGVDPVQICRSAFCVVNTC